MRFVAETAIAASLITGMSTLLPVTSAIAQTDTPKMRYSIEAQSLSRALQLFARKSGIEILFVGDDVAGKRSRAVRGATC